MNHGIELLSDLNDNDIEWLLSTGTERQVISGTIVLEEGLAPTSLVYVIEGLLGVRIESLGNREVATLSPGEILGEISFLEGGAATATVSAVENSLLLEVPFTTLQEGLEANPELASRLYRAFATTATRRLRQREQAFSRLLSVNESESSTKSELSEQLLAAAGEFKALLLDVDKASLKEGVIGPEDEQRVRTAFVEFVAGLNAMIGDASDLHPSVREDLGAQVQREVLPFLLMTRNAERLYAKPRGYAGDYMSIDWMYENQPDGAGRLGPLLDRCFLDEPAAAAVRNRRGLLTGQIQRHLDRHPDRPVRITTMACGPAREVFDAFAALDDPTRLEVTLIDIDQQALEQVDRTVAELELEKQVRSFHGNLVYLAMGRQKIDLAAQDLIYSIGLIDYFNDKFVDRLINYGHRCLTDGGEMILGNFHPKNPDKALMDYVIDWRLIHRTEDDMNRLFAASAFGHPCSAIHFEDAGVNLFAVCGK